MKAPRREQVLQLARVIRNSQKNRQRLAVHCLAGMGRTSTMLMAAHMALGEPLQEVRTRLARQNPCFALTGQQAEFIRAFSEGLSQPSRET